MLAKSLSGCPRSVMLSSFTAPDLFSSLEPLWKVTVVFVFVIVFVNVIENVHVHVHVHLHVNVTLC